MLIEGRSTFHGKYYEVTDAVCSPAPLQSPRPPLMLAGQGEKVLLRIVAQHADMWNTQGRPERMKYLIERMRDHGDKIGRDTSEIEKTVAITLCYQANREREEQDQRFAAVLGRTSPEEARKQMMIGSKLECLDKIEQYVNAGVTHFIFVSMRPFEVGEIAAFAEDVIATVRPR